MTYTSRLPFGGDAPHTRKEFQRALLHLCEPLIRGQLQPGEHRLVSAVFADASGDDTGFARPPDHR